jgi:hypothetical protein
MPKHREIAERALGKKLPKGVHVHHFDGDRSNNVPTNLVVCPSAAYHFLLHARIEAYQATGDANKRKCAHCGQWDDQENISFYFRNYRYIPGRKWKGSHRWCSKHEAKP